MCLEQFGVTAADIPAGLACVLQGTCPEVKSNMQGTSADSMKRVLESVLSRHEAAVLRFLAARTPNRVNSDHLTVLGFLGMTAAGLLYYAVNWNSWALVAVNGAILLNWLGDSLDGTLARFRNRQRPRYGYYVDHVIDSVGATILFAGLGLSPLMSIEVAVVFLIAYLLVAINSYLAASTVGEFRISFFQFGPTELRLLMILGNLVAIAKPTVNLFGHTILLFDVGYGIGALGMLLTLLVAFVRNLNSLRRLEPL